MDYLDHTAVAILAKLGDPADAAKLCPPCLIAAIDVERWTLMKAVRALMLCGRILCVYERCLACRTIDLVVSHRRPPFSS